MKHPQRSRRLALCVIPLGLLGAGLIGSAGSSQAAGAEPSLADYKYFRALSLDLLGRMPTPKELAEFEKPGFNLDQWIDARLQGEDYAERLTRVYADLLRPQINGLRYNQARTALASVVFKAPSGALTRLYYRPTQQRARITALRAQLSADSNYKLCAAIRDPARDPQYQALGCAQYEKFDNLIRAGMCLQADELGLRYNGGNFAPTPFPAVDGDQPGTPPRVGPTQAALDQYTRTVRPWWLYADHRAASPSQRYDAAAWAARYPGFVPGAALTKEPGGMVDTLEIRVCKEELATALTAPADALKNPDGTPLQVSCLSGHGAANSAACGCGPGLEWCLPAASHSTTFPAAAFVSSRNVLLGVDDPTDQVGFTFFDWHNLWLGQEPLMFLSQLFKEDRDVREMVTARWSVVNGPLAQFYRFAARSFTGEQDLSALPLPNNDSMPKDLLPMETTRWAKVADRGENAAGVLTQPWFTMKNATRRARAHVLYNAFMCREFAAPPGLQLAANKEPNLMLRDGCAVCHHTLEPLSAYFARVPENSWLWLNAKLYPTQNPACKKPSATGTIPSACAGLYDNQFSTTGFGMLRGAYGSPENSDAGPAGVGRWLAQQPEFASCVVQNVATSFLGRDLRSEDAALKQELVDALVKGGYKIRPMVKALLRSKAYRSANNLAPSVWRKEGN